MKNRRREIVQDEPEPGPEKIKANTKKYISNNPSQDHRARPNPTRPNQTDPIQRSQVTPNRENPKGKDIKHGKSAICIVRKVTQKKRVNNILSDVAS